MPFGYLNWRSRAVGIIGLGLALSLSGRVIRADSPPGDWTHFTNRNVKTSLMVTGDSLWAGTAGGVVLWDLADMSHQEFNTSDGLSGSDISRFDGRGWQSIHPARSVSFGSLESVQCIFLDSQGRLWLDVCYWDPPQRIKLFRDRGLDLYQIGVTAWTWYSEFLNPEYFQFQQGYDIKDVLEDETGRLWFATDIGVLRLKGESTGLYFDGNSNLQSNDINALAIDSSRAVWSATTWGVYRLDGDQWTAFTEVEGLVHNYVTSMTVDPAGDIWCGTLKGIARYDGVRWTKYPSPAGIVEPVILSVAVDPDGRIYCGSENEGLFRFDGAEWSNYRLDCPPFSLWPLATSRTFRGAVVGPDNAKYFGATSDGVLQFHRGNWRLFSRADGLKDPDIWDMAVDSTGHPWANTRFGVGRWNGYKWDWFDETDGLPANRCRDLTVDRAGQIWLTTDGGISRYDDGSWINYEYNRYPGRSSLALDYRGHLWFGLQGGVLEFDGTVWRKYEDSRWFYVDDQTGEWVGSTVRSIVPDPTGGLYFLAGFDPVRFDYTTNHWIFKPDTPRPLQNGLVYASAVDRQGRVWLAGEGGAAWFDQGGWHSVTRADGLAYNLVRDIAVDSGGLTWFVHDLGISRFQPVGTSSVGQPAPAATTPTRMILRQNFPNPFNAATNISFHLPRS